MNRRDEYIEKTKAGLDKVNAELAELEASIDEAVDEADDKRKEMLAKLHEQSDALKERLAQLRNKGEDSWEEFKGEVEHVRKAFVHSYNYFRSQL